jgi:hypothetical protein
MSPPVPAYAAACTGRRKQEDHPRPARPPPTIAASMSNAVPCTGAGNCEVVAISYAAKPSGPWKNFVPQLSAADHPGGGGRQSIIANPGPLVLSNGSVMLVYRCEEL